jgi:transcriptional antiterminator RfaH
MINWFAVHTQPLREQVAKQHLLEQGFEVYLPKFKKVRRHARKVEEVLAPLFPRYLFIGMDLETSRWRSVNGTRGVSYLLTNNDRPLAVPSKIIEGLKTQESEDGLVPIASLLLFTKGEKVRILDGAFKDQIAVFENMDNKERVQLLLNFLGRETKISLPHYEVEAA